MTCCEVETQEEFAAAVARGDCVHVCIGEYTAYGSATVTAYGSATVRAYDSATVTASDRSVVSVLAASVALTLAGWATAILHADCHPATRGTGCVVVHRIITDCASWLVSHGAECARGRMRLYKWVEEDGSATGGFRYTEGVVTAPDWDADPLRECGGGLHACASLRDALPYRDDRTHAVEILVHPEDARPPLPSDEHPNKLRFRSGEVVRFWRPTEADIWGEES